VTPEPLADNVSQRCTLDEFPIAPDAGRSTQFGSALTLTPRFNAAFVLEAAFEEWGDLTDLPSASIRCVADRLLLSEL
jgi:hypothetical protein